MDSGGNAGRLRLICDKENGRADGGCGLNKDDDKDNKDDKDYNKGVRTEYLRNEYL